jgi:hypothetical protein
LPIVCYGPAWDLTHVKAHSLGRAGRSDAVHVLHNTQLAIGTIHQIAWILALTGGTFCSRDWGLTTLATFFCAFNPLLERTFNTCGVWQTRCSYAHHFLLLTRIARLAFIVITWVYTFTILSVALCFNIWVKAQIHALIGTGVSHFQWANIIVGALLKCDAPALVVDGLVVWTPTARPTEGEPQWADGVGVVARWLA